MKRFFCSIFFLLFSFFSAGAEIFDHPLSAATESVFAAVCKTISSHPIQNGEFTQTKTITKLNRNLVSSGTYIISQKDGILWNTQKPFPSVMAVTKSGIIQTNASGKKSKLDAKGNVTFEHLSAVISAVFQGNAEALRKNFTIYFDGTEQNWTTALVPKDTSLRRIIPHILMNGSTGIDSILMAEQSGDSVRYQFKNQAYADSLSEKEKSYFKE